MPPVAITTTRPSPYASTASRIATPSLRKRSGRGMGKRNMLTAMGNAARMGITILPRMLVDEDLRAGTLVTLLEDFPVASYWVKMLVPRMKINRPVVHALVAFLKESMQAIQPAQP
jgi:DNA-binding transcriptional LysR family regulator